MAQAKIYWNRENFQMVEKIFRKSVEYCNDNDTWKLNVAHVLFMQNKYKEAIGFYEPIVKKHYDNVSLRADYYLPVHLWAPNDDSVTSALKADSVPFCPGGAV